MCILGDIPLRDRVLKDVKRATREDAPAPAPAVCAVGKLEYSYAMDGAALTISVNVKSLRRSASGVIHGQIHLCFGEVVFPGRGWDDFVVAFLVAWLRAVIGLWRSAHERERVRFFDGPYWAELSTSRAAQGSVEVVLVADQSGVPVTQHLEIVEVSQLGRNALSVGRELLSVCANEGWNDSDLEDLAEQVTVLSNFVEEPVQ